MLGKLYGIGRQAGLTDAEMDACMQDRAMAEALVAEYQKNAAADGVDGTPTFLINGEKGATCPTRSCGEARRGARRRGQAGGGGGGLPLRQQRLEPLGGGGQLALVGELAHGEVGLLGVGRAAAEGGVAVRVAAEGGDHFAGEPGLVLENPVAKLQVLGRRCDEAAG